MNNERFGFYAAWAAAIATALFALFMLIPDKRTSDILPYGASMFISLGYLCLTCAFASTARPERKAVAYAGIGWAAVYAAYINLVYYTQLTTVLHGTASEGVLQAIVYRPGSWFFNMDLFGYGIMCLSSFFVALSIAVETKADKWLRTLLLLHGVFAIGCVVLPVLNVLGPEQNAEAGNQIGTIALVFWCIYFIPIMVLAAGYFKKRFKSVS
jgi:hypothetical protein